MSRESSSHTISLTANLDEYFREPVTQAIRGRDVGASSATESYLVLLLSDFAKPLECVGEVAECRLALELAAEKDEWKNTDLVPVLLRDIPADAMPTPEQKEEIFSTAEHLIPDAYLSALDQIA